MSASDTEKLERRTRELAILKTIAEALNQSVELDAALHVVLAQVADLLGLDTGWIWLLDEATGRSALAAAQNLPPALADDPRRMEGGCYCLDSYRAGDFAGAANVNVVKCSRLFGLVDNTDGLRYHASIPLYAHGKQLGVLNVASVDWQRLSPDDLRLLYTIGDMLGVAVERARLFARSARLGAVEERNRLAREIHDTLAQNIAAIALQLETADALLEADGPARAQQAVQRALALAQATIEEVRRSVLDLRAAPLDARALPEALAHLASEWSEQTGVPLDFEAVGDCPPLAARVENGLYRIAQELLTNVTRHAGASRALLRFEAKAGELRVIADDDGCGFDATTAVGGRFGLVGIAERARLLGGAARIESAPGAGTRVEVTVPLAPRQEQDG